MIIAPTESMLPALIPMTNIFVAVWVYFEAVSVNGTIQECAQVVVSIFKVIHASPISQVVVIQPFVSVVFLLRCALAVALAYLCRLVDKPLVLRPIWETLRNILQLVILCTRQLIKYNWWKVVLKHVKSRFSVNLIMRWDHVFYFYLINQVKFFIYSI